MKAKFENRKQSTYSKSKVPLLVGLGLIGALVCSYFLIPSVEQFFNEAWKVLTSDDEQKVKHWVDGFGWVGPIVLILAMILQMFMLVIPTIVLMVVAILAYGPIWGSLLVLVAVLSASTVGYIIGRYIGPVVVERLIGKKAEDKVAGFLEDYGFWAIVITRINPFLSNDAISFVAGILSMRYLKFAAATLVGIAPLTVFIAVIGQSTDQLKSGLLWGSIGSLILFGGYIFWDRKNKKQ